MTDPKTLPLVAVVEDDAPLRKALGRLLRIAGFDVSLFESAEEYLDAPPAAGCLVLDVMLPGMSGLELLEQLRAKPGVPPVIFTTAGHDASARERAEQLGCAAFFWKPVDPQELIDTILAVANRVETPTGESESLG